MVDLVGFFDKPISVFSPHVVILVVVEHRWTSQDSSIENPYVVC